MHVDRIIERQGALLLGESRTRFRVWAPAVHQIAVELLDGSGRIMPMQPASDGYYELTIDNVPAGANYLYVLDGDRRRPDPASRFQPEGVHGPSQVVSRDFNWTDTAWRGIAWQDYA